MVGPFLRLRTTLSDGRQDRRRLRQSCQFGRIDPMAVFALIDMQG
jgi:hypothetical protein